MKAWVLGSGSRGNAIVLECADSRVLVDAGFAPRVLAARLGAVGVAPESIEAVVITHEHTDHVRGAAAAAKRWRWALYATTGTARAFPELRAADVRTFDAGDTLSLAHLELRSIRTSHDAAESVALVATACASGARIGLAYDMGVVTESVRDGVRDLDMLFLEANHDEAMLQNGPYPRVVRDRIAGRFGHLSNRDAAQLARDVAHSGLQHLVLAHLSEKCNDPRLATATVADGVRRTRFRGHLSVSRQDEPCGPFQVRGTRSAVQLALAL